MQRMKVAIFDMDGTLANLYAVEGWLEMLEAEDVTPYLVAETMLNMQALAHRLNTLQRKGYRLGIISWLALGGSADYGDAVTAAKQRWLQQHLGSVQWDEIHIVPFGRSVAEYWCVGSRAMF